MNKKYRLIFIALLTATFMAITGVWTNSQYWIEQNAEDELIAGQNVNMVAGDTLPDGDPWLQRQNEPSLAVSTRNPLHLLAAANDYRTVDVPFTQGALPGLPEGTAAGDAWIGIFKSFNGGESWISTLLPGYPQSNDNASPLYGYDAAADPVVRAGIDGLFYVSGIVFHRDETTKEIGDSAVFVARYRDNNNKEKGDTFEYLGAEIVDRGNAGQFLDKSWLAVDIPRNGNCGNVYVAYADFVGNKNKKAHGKLLVARSSDCGMTWDHPIQMSDAGHPHQGASIAIDPENGKVYVAWRLFEEPKKKKTKGIDSLIIAQSDDFGNKFSKPVQVAEINPFDQPTHPLMFRTNCYPTMAVDDTGIVYLAWSEHGMGPNGESRLMLVTSTNGTKWSNPKPIENPETMEGHQFMPTMAFANGKLMVAWYDSRNDYSQQFTEYIDETHPEYRHTVDVRIARAEPGNDPVFEPSIQISRYIWVIQKTNGEWELKQAQWNPANYPQFQGGTTPFMGDYIDISPSPVFVWDEGEKRWRFNTEPADSAVFHVAWTDNRDVKPPGPETGFDWTNYTPPDYSNRDFDSNTQRDCEAVYNRPGMRNQNVYTARISQGLEVGSTGNSKPLNVLRAFVVFVKNTTDEVKNFRLTIGQPEPGGQASFLQFSYDAFALTELEVAVAPRSSVSRPVFFQSDDENASVRVDVVEIDYAGPEGNPVPGGLTSFVILNPGDAAADIEDPDGWDPSKGSIEDEEIYDPKIELSTIFDWSKLSVPTPNMFNPNMFNPNMFNPSMFNPNMFNTFIVNPNMFNPNMFNPNMFNPNMFNPNMFNPNMFNPNMFNPNMFNAAVPDDVDLTKAKVVDVVWDVKNGGNTTSSYTFKTFAKDALPEGIFVQLIVYRTSYTPTTNGLDCGLKSEPHHELLSNIVNPNMFNPNMFNPNMFNPNMFNAGIENATFSVPPGDEVSVLLRLIEENPAEAKFLANGELFDLKTFAEETGGGVTAQEVNTEDAQAGITTPPAASTKLLVGTSHLPDGTVNTVYGPNVYLTAVGGTPPYAWSLNEFELPPGLNYIPTSGQIYGTPTQEGTYSFFAEVTDSGTPDSAPQTDTQSLSITIFPSGVTPELNIITETLPSGVDGNYYGASLQAAGGTQPYIWSRISGSLPSGLSLDGGGTISGRPTTEGTYNFVVRVQDVLGASDTQALSIQINPSTQTAYTISGTIRMSDGQTPSAGVLMRGLPGTPVTDASGFYTDTVPGNWSGTVSPFKVGYSFVDPETTYPPVNSNITTDYTAYSTIVDHFLVEAEGGGDIGTQTAYAPFSITINAVDSDGLLVRAYSGTNSLSDSTSTISPTTTGSLVNGTWTGDVTISAAGTGVTISTTGAGKTGESNAFDVIAGPAQEDIYEPNNSFSEAAPISLGTHTNLAYFDQDWFIVTVSAADSGKDLKVHVQGTSYPDPNERQDMDFAVFNSSEKMLSYNLSGSDDETVYIADLVAGDYIIGINYSSQDGAVYTLTAEIGDSQSFGIGYIEGRVTEEDGTTGIEDILVELYGVPFDWDVSRPLITTDSQGYYRIGYAPGDYQVRFNVFDFRWYAGMQWAPDRNYIGEYYDDTYSGQEGQILSIVGGATRQDVNSQLVKGGSISGAITVPGGNPVESAYVYARNLRGQRFDSTWADGAGQYTLNRLPPGHFKVHVRPFSENYANEWYDDKPCFDDADPVHVAVTGDQISGVDFQLNDGASVEGTVTDAGNGSQLQGVNVRVYDPTQTAQIFLQQVNTDSSGDYSIGRLTEGQVKVRFLPPSGTSYVGEWYDDKRLFEEADLVPTAAGQITEPIDAQLSEGGAIIGQVTDGSQGLYGIFVVCVDVNSGHWYSATTDSNGNYRINNVPVGSYKVRFRANYGNYATEWHDNKGSYSVADPVTVAVGQETTVDAVLLENGGYITGTVTANAIGVEGVRVWARDSTYDSTISWAFTDANGDYSIPRMPTCDAKIYFDTDQNNLPYASEWYDDRSSYDEADTVQADQGGTISNIDADLAQRSPLTITTTSLPGGTAGTPYSATLEASGGIWNYNWSLVSGSLPDGLSLHGNGIIDGTPTTPDTFNFTVQAVDSSYPPQSDSQALSITVSGAAGATKVVFTTQPGGGVGGQAWSQQPVVEVKDAADNTVTSDNSTEVSITILYNPSSGTLSGIDHLTVVNGVATFTDLAIDMGGYDYTLQTSASGLSADTSAAFDIEGFSYTSGDMNVKRLNHTATLLNDGLALVAGGENQSLITPEGNPYNDSVESYSTATGLFVLVDSLHGQKSKHTATLLADGRVLFTGGEGYEYPYTAGDPVVTMDNQDIYTPGSGIYWHQTNYPLVATMNHPRKSHTATLLFKGPDAGKVLIAGGALDTDTAELYDPGTTGSPLDSAFTILADPMNGERHDHTATRLLDGRVLITGGRDDVWDSPSGTVLSSAEIYDPATGEFTPTGSMNEARVYHAATLLPDGKVLITGGFQAQPQEMNLDTAEIYDPGSGTFSYIGSPQETMNLERSHHSAVHLGGGFVLIVGGDPNGSAEIYDHASGEFRYTGSLPSDLNLQDNGAVLLSDGLRVLVCGGNHSSNNPVKQAVIWNPVRIPGLAVTSISPSCGSTLQSALDVTVRGTDFIAGASVELNFDGTNPITASNVVVSATQITCTFDLTGVTTHLGEAWDVRVINSEAESATGENLFTIWQPDILEGLVGHYRFNGNADDSSGNGNDGTAYGGPNYAQDRYGNPNGAIVLDGTDDYVELPNESVFDLTEITIVAIVKVPNYDRENYIITKGLDFGNYTLEIIGPSSGNQGKAGYVHDITSGGNWSHLVSSNPIPTDQFIHIAISADYNAATLQTYINGVQEYNLTSGVPPPLANDNKVSIGRAGFSGGDVIDYQFFLGTIDEIRIYDRALSESEIAAIYNSMH